MFTIVIIAVACAVAIGHDAAAQPVSSWDWRLAMVFGTIAAVGMSARLVTMTAVGLCRPSENYPTSRLIRMIARLEQAHLALWLVSVAFLLFIVDWVTIVRTNWRLSHSVLLDEALILGPILLPWFISWAYFFDLPDRDSSQHSRWSFVWRQARITLGLGLLPVLVVSGAADIADLWAADWRSSPLAPAVFVLPLLAMLGVFPYFLRMLWPTTVLSDGKLRSRLEQFASKRGIELREIFIWETSPNVLNAAVTGLIPGFRYVFLTRGLIQQMSLDDIEAVFAHELAHIRFRHLYLRIVALAMPLAICLLLSGVGSDFIAVNPTHESAATAVTIAFTLTYLIVVMGWYSRQLEHQADLWACEELSVSLGLATGQQRYGRVLSMMTAADEESSSTWLHPSPVHRLAVLRATLGQPTKPQRFHRKLSWLAWVISAVAILAGLKTLLLALN